MIAPINITCVVDFMCPWSFIGLRSLELAMQQQYPQNVNEMVRIQLLPYEFDPPGTYPPEGTDWTEYCQSFGPQKAKYLLEEKLPRAFSLGKQLGIEFDIRRRIVHTVTVNAALMLVQQEPQDQQGSHGGMEFALSVLHQHFEKLNDPNDPEVLSLAFKDLTNKIDNQKIELFFHDSTNAVRNQQWSTQARELGAPPVPKFIVTCGNSSEDLVPRLLSTGQGPTEPKFFLELFQICEGMMECTNDAV